MFAMQTNPAQYLDNRVNIFLEVSDRVNVADSRRTKNSSGLV